MSTRDEFMEAAVIRLIAIDDQRKVVAEDDEGDALFALPLAAEYRAVMFELRQLVLLSEA